MASVVTLAQMVTEVRRRTNIPTRFNFIPDVELVSIVNSLCQELYDLLCSVGGQEWFRKDWQIVTNSVDDTYPLPPDFYILTSADVTYDTQLVRPLLPYMEKERSRYQVWGSWGIGLPAYYRMLGKNQLRFIPSPGGIYTVTLHGYPTFTKLEVASYTDATQKQIALAPAAFDGINGWEEWVIWKAVSYVEGKRKTDSSYADQRADELKARILGMALNRDMQNPERVQDVVGWDYWDY